VCHCLRKCQPLRGHDCFCSILNRLSDVTAIWNTNAFFAYIITVRLFKLKWEFRKILAVLIATFGVLAVVYGDARNTDVPPADYREAPDADVSIDGTKPKAPLLGDLLTLCASVGYGLYQVMYKRYAALPSDPEFEPGTAYDPLPDSEDGPAHGLNGGNIDVDGLTYPPPFGLHANLLTCGIGLMTFFTLWIMLPILHYCGYERFRLPPDLLTTLSIAGIAGSGLVFNGGLMVTVLYVLYSSLLFDSYF
jgi:drug/metabolite transporter (DMT)-like permease